MKGKNGRANVNPKQMKFQSKTIIRIENWIDTHLTIFTLIYVYEYTPSLTGGEEREASTAEEGP